MVVRQLPNVSLVCIDTQNPLLATWALKRLFSQFDFGESILVTAHEQHNIAEQLPDPCRIVYTNEVRTIEDYSKFIIRDLQDLITTDYVLICQWDGFVINPECLTEEFFQYDYIGAPWPDQKPPFDVGNGGFSLRSRRLLKALDQIAFSEYHPEDEHICRTHRLALEELGVRFAPTDVARRFSYEFTRPTLKTFGFHGLSNFPDFMMPDELLQYLPNLPKNIVFNNYFLEFCRKILHAKTDPLNLCRAPLLKLIKVQIQDAAPSRLLTLQSKQLLSGLCRLGLKAEARLLARRRLQQNCSLENLRLFAKTYL